MRYRAALGLGGALDEYKGTICSGAASGPKNCAGGELIILKSFTDEC